MKPSFIFFTLFSLILWFGNTINARKDISGGYWRGVMEDQPTPEATQGLVGKDLTSNEEKIMKKYFFKDFEPAIGNNRIWTYNDFTKSKFFAEEFEPMPNGVLKGKKSFAKEFEPGPDITIYDNEASV